MSEPVRTCVGCRRAEPRRGLVRVVLADGRAVVDERRRLPGRGAWVHRTRACVQNAVRGGLSRSFRSAVDGRAILALASVEDPSASGGGGDPPRRDSALASATQKS